MFVILFRKQFRKKISLPSINSVFWKITPIPKGCNNHKSDAKLVDFEIAIGVDIFSGL